MTGRHRARALGGYELCPWSQSSSGSRPSSCSCSERVGARLRLALEAAKRRLVFVSGQLIVAPIFQIRIAVHLIEHRDESFEQPPRAHKAPGASEREWQHAG